jgi:hypothetical protein
MIEQLDPRDKANGSVDEWLEQAQRDEADVTADQARRINDLINAWADENPDGYGGMDAYELDRAVMEILAEPERQDPDDGRD